MSTGMELLEAIRAERADPPSGIRTLGLDVTHRWITSLSPGRVQFAWPIDDHHFNLEAAVICSWTVAVADQALFFAGTSLCGEGEGTRMADLHLQAIANIESGPVSVDAVIDQRIGNRMFATCTMTLPDGTVAARVVATLDVI